MEQPIGGAILHIAMNIDVNWEEESPAWYAEEHIADLMSAPGVRQRAAIRPRFGPELRRCGTRRQVFTESGAFEDKTGSRRI